MNTNGRILSIFVYMALATTALTFGTSNVAASTQLMSSNYLPTFAATNSHQNSMIADINGNNSNGVDGNYYSRSPTAYEFAQYAWSHPHHRHNSAGQNDIVATSGANPTNTVDSSYSSSFSPTQYGSGSHPHHHHSSTNMIADINGDHLTSWPNTFSWPGSLPP
jgi:hypothetical protein